MQRKLWGRVGQQPIWLFTMPIPGGLEAKIINFGAALVALTVSDNKGELDDVVLGFDDLGAYLADRHSFGVIVGRHANRIAGAQFSLGGIRYQLAENNGANHIHGGPGGFGKVIWQPREIMIDGQQALRLNYFSAHGEEGYPGNVEAEVTYSGVAGGGLRLDYIARSDQDTVLNLTNHAYFNLAGQGAASILDHELVLDADFFTPIDAEGLCTGEIRGVAGTPFDFRQSQPIGQRLEADHEQLRAGKGYDHNWVIKRSAPGLARAARVSHRPSGRVLEVWTTKPGIQFYSGNSLGGQRGKGGASYPRRSGFCLETQFFPNSLGFSHFPSVVLRAGALYKQTTIYRFGLEEGDFGGCNSGQ